MSQPTQPPRVWWSEYEGAVVADEDGVLWKYQVLADYMDELPADAIEYRPASAPAAPVDPHDGDTCEEVERQLDDAVGELNMTSEWLVKFGLPINYRDNPDKHLSGFVFDALHSGRLRVVKKRRWFR